MHLLPRRLAVGPVGALLAQVGLRQRPPLWEAKVVPDEALVRELVTLGRAQIPDASRVLARARELMEASGDGTHD